MTAYKEALILDWLARLEIIDPETIERILDLCRADVDALDYFLGRAAADLPKHESFPDDRRPGWGSWQEMIHKGDK